MLTIEILFEKMEAIDLEEVITIEQASFSSPWTKEMFYSEFFDNPLSFSYVARSDDQVIGYLFFWEVVGELHLMNIAVAGLYRRKGIAQRLIEKMIEIGRGRAISKIFLEVRAANVQALSLYQKLHFYQIGIRKNYYHSPKEDAIVLQYNFGPNEICHFERSEKS
ncbi:MAG: ribosomal protein S18-alanine N-acetyltransferase [Nitrospirota bacterium]